MRFSRLQRTEVTPLWAALALAFLVVGGATASGAEIHAVEIVRYGIFTADLQSAKRTTQGILQNTSTNFRLLEQTTTVPIKLGVRFGVELRVVGAPRGAPVTVRAGFVYPPGKVRSPKVSEPLRDSFHPTAVNIGAITYEGYRLDDPWELVPGEWHFQVWSGNKMLAEKTFTLSASEGR